MRRGRNATEQAVSDRARLSEQLTLRTKEVDEVTRRFQALGEVVPIILCFATPDGHLSYANNKWYEITGFAKGSQHAISFLNSVAEQDV